MWRRQRGEKRSDLARACRREGTGGRNGRSGGITRRVGHAPSASSLSDARTGASSTEKSSFIADPSRACARAVSARLYGQHDGAQARVV